MPEPKPLTDEELADLRRAVMPDSNKAVYPVGYEHTARLVATIDAIKAELNGARAGRRHASDLMDRAHQQCDLAGIEGLPGADLVSLPERVERLRTETERAEARVKFAKAQRDKLRKQGQRALSVLTRLARDPYDVRKGLRETIAETKGK